MIEKLDFNLRGITHIDGKVIFVDNALPGEEVKVDILKDEKTYSIAEVKEYITKSPKRIKSKCPYFDTCGGCMIRNLNYNDGLNYKKDNVIEIIKRNANIDINPKVIKNEQKDLYRNKIEIKCIDGKYGFYKRNSHNLVEIDRCLNAEEPINKMIMHLEDLNLTNGEIIIKCNNMGEILLNIITKDTCNIDIDHLREKVKLVGIVYNDKIIYGNDYFMETIDNKLYKESYNSFFQVNRYINEKLIRALKENIDDNSIVLDLCCGVGTLGLSIAEKCKKVYGIEIVKNAIEDAIFNAKINNINNAEYILGDAFVLMEDIKDIDTIIIDPPRNGISKNGIKNILNKKVNKLIYISCNPITLARDLNLLKEEYDIKKSYVLDMFSYTNHIESLVVLERKK